LKIAPGKEEVILPSEASRIVPGEGAPASAAKRIKSIPGFPPVQSLQFEQLAQE